jgi:hypothetical protein
LNHGLNKFLAIENSSRLLDHWKNGAEAHALQTRREYPTPPSGAKRLECGRFSDAFRCHFQERRRSI